MILVIALISLALSTFVAQKIGAPKGRQGWLWGFLLGWIGVIIVACLSDKNPRTVALTGKQAELAELEADVRLAELRQRQAALMPDVTPAAAALAE